MDKKKQILETTDAYPHNGKMLDDYFTKHNVNRAELARKLNLTRSTVMQYRNTQSLKFGILWNMSLALKHNFVAELCELLPVEYTTAREIALQEQVDNLQKELDKLNIELSVYKNIVGK